MGRALKCRQRFAYIPRPENDGGALDPECGEAKFLGESALNKL